MAPLCFERGTLADRKSEWIMLTVELILMVIFLQVLHNASVFLIKTQPLHCSLAYYRWQKRIGGSTTVAGQYSGKQIKHFLTESY